MRTQATKKKHEEIRNGTYRIWKSWRCHEQQSTTLYEEKMYNQCILHVLAYGSDTWQRTRKQERKQGSGQRQLEKKTLGVPWRSVVWNMDKRTNEGLKYFHDN